MHSTLEINSNIKNYKVQFIETTKEISLLLDNPEIVVFIDKNVNNLYPELYRETNIVLECTEELKTLEGAFKVYNLLIEKKANKHTKVIAIGGGILQDVVGFCCSTYCRGIEYDFVPTTLLAQADSCIGGKTSINVKGRKNILGTFYPPTRIFICVKFLDTLSTLDFHSGLGEIYKFYILQHRIEEFDRTGNIREMILQSLLFKKNILLNDEFDKGERLYLNFGHTFGHALETSSSNNIPHGIAVILGCMVASRVAAKLGHKVPNFEILIDKGVDLVKQVSISLKKDWFKAENLLDIVKSDKKSSGRLTMVFSAEYNFLQDVYDVEIIKQALRETYESF